MADIQIRRVRAQDVHDLQRISRETFFQAFAAANTKENMEHYLRENLSRKRLAAELAHEQSEFYFAVTDDTVIGYLKLNYGEAQTELKDEYGLEIERIYVLETFYGKNVGQLLYHKALEIAKERNAPYLWLGVWEENARAIRFYEKNGFKRFGKHNFMLGDDKQTDILMKQQLP